MTKYMQRMRPGVMHFCDCGQVAARFVRGGWGCERCIGIEDRMEADRARHIRLRCVRGLSNQEAREMFASAEVGA